MTETLLQQIEDKVLLLLAEITNLRQEVVHLRQENQALKSEQGTHSDKLEELISLLDILEEDNQKSLKIESLTVVM
jgi:regulator of replication initiation timing